MTVSRDWAQTAQDCCHWEKHITQDEHPSGLASCLGHFPEDSSGVGPSRDCGLIEYRRQVWFVSMKAAGNEGTEWGGICVEMVPHNSTQRFLAEVWLHMCQNRHHLACRRWLLWGWELPHSRDAKGPKRRCLKAVSASLCISCCWSP